MAALRARIRRMEGDNRGARAEGVPFGVAAIDSRLPGGGLARGALHEVTAVHAGAATGFCATLLARLMGDRAPALWCTQPRLMEAGDLHAPGLARFGLMPERLMVVRAGRDREVLWVMEEALRCRRLAAVLGEVRDAGLTASRRVQLAAATSGVTAMLLRPGSGVLAPSAAETRWRVAAAPSWTETDTELEDPDTTRWQVELIRCRGGMPGNWLMEWRHETDDFALAAPLRHRPAG
jgi:protein ImuA